ncbi:MAG: hypothetical protein R3D34_09580 [Nitratireductor sp.]
MAQENASKIGLSRAALSRAGNGPHAAAVFASSANRIAAARSGMRLFGNFESGQVLAGTGALVFEGELLEQPRCH